MIISLSVVVPSHVVAREASEKIKSFEQVTGILKTRRWAGNTRTLAMAAVDEHREKVLNAQPGAVVFVTQSPDRNSPSMANDIARELNLPTSVPVFDVNQSCSGFVYGWWIARQISSSLRGNPVLLICVDRLRGLPGSTDDLIFSDAACSAIVMDYGTPQFRFFTLGTGVDSLKGDEKGRVKMDGGAVFDFVTKNIPQFIKSMGVADVLVQHQANLSMMKLVDKRSGYDGRSVHSISEYGNMSMVSIPAAIASNEDKLSSKQVVLCGYGAGWSAAAVSVFWPAKPCATLVEVSG